MTYLRGAAAARGKAHPGAQKVAVTGLSLLLAAGFITTAASDLGRSDRTFDVVLTAARSTSLGTYSNDKAAITVTKQVSGTGTDTVTSYVADVTLTDPLALKAVFANKTYGRNITAMPSAMAASVNAVLAVNGDYYGFRDDGAVVRNGQVYREKGARQGLVINRDGTMALYDETKTTAAQQVANGAWHILSFGPGLVDSGAILPGLDTYEFSDTLTSGVKTTVQGNHPRTGIGMIAKNHFVMIVVDGRNPGYSRGVTLSEFAQMFLDAGATLAYNLDGGGSSTMYFNGKVINQPRDGSSSQTERKSSDILFIAR